MKVLLAFLGVAVLVVNGSKRQAVPMKTYKVDLNDPPETRWNHVLEPYLSSIPLVVSYFDTLVPKEIAPLAEAVLSDMDKYLGEYGKELEGIAKYTNLDLGMLIGLNLMYELRRFGGGHPNITGGDVSSNDAVVFGCTSIVAQDENGHIYHGHNMDWNLPNDLRNMTVQIEFYHGNQFLFKGITTVGYVGIITGVSANRFSVSINERDLGGSPFLDALEALTVNNSRLPTHILREVLEQASDYSDAHRRLSSVHLVAPVYYIIAGTDDNEGAVLSHDRNSNTREQTLGKASYSDWYLMETNYDYWESPPTYDDRRLYAHRYLQSMGRANASSIDGIMTVLSEWPVWNRFTAYTATIDPSTTELRGYDIYDI